MKETTVSVDKITMTEEEFINRLGLVNGKLIYLDHNIIGERTVELHVERKGGNI